MPAFRVLKKKERRTVRRTLAEVTAKLEEALRLSRELERKRA